MANWLDENATLLYMLFGMAALVLLVLWWRTRQRRVILGAAGAIALLALVWLLGYVIPLVFGESDKQQIERKIREMAEGVKARDLERVFTHISDEIHFQTTHGKKDFRRNADNAIRSHNPEDVLIWDFEAKEISRQKRTAKVEFMVKAKGNWPGSEVGYRCEAEFVLDADNQWRLKGFQIFNPYVDTHQPIQIPGF